MLINLYCNCIFNIFVCDVQQVKYCKNIALNFVYAFIKISHAIHSSFQFAVSFSVEFNSCFVVHIRTSFCCFQNIIGIIQIILR